MKLKKELKLIDVFCITSGAMLSGLFILPGLAYIMAGPGVLVSYLLAAILALTGLLSQAELATAMPKAGGTYFYVTRSMGSAVGTVYGLITWLSLALKSAYELVFIGMIMTLLLSINIPPWIWAVAACLMFLGINLIGIKEAGRIQGYLLLSVFGVLVFFCYQAFPEIHPRNFEYNAVQDWDSVLSAAGFVFVSFGGLLKIASIAEEVKEPGRTLPLGMMLSLLVITLVYFLVVLVTIAVLGSELSEPENAQWPLSAAAGHFLDGTGKTLLGIAAIFAIITAANAGIMAASRYPLALARDNMMPEIFGRINHRFNTPHLAIFVTGAVIISALFFDITVLVKAASTVLILTYIFTCLAVIVLRESRVQNYQPEFRSPLYPWVQIVGIIGFLVLLFKIGTTGLVTTAILTLLGFAVYWFFGRKAAAQEYALLHLIERITAQELTSHKLETELKFIIHERDEILKDRFDHLIDDCPVLDIKEAVTVEEFFHQAADALAEDLHVSTERIFNALMERETESSTVLTPFLAIPHIVIKGEKHFDILLARCKEGIDFGEKAPKVHTVFVLIGTRDERNFHLMSLAAIAKIVEGADFEKNWMSAKTTEVLRDIVLLGKRKRQL
ncbi:MAG: amino acid permease [Planctomycetes bacterium]|nr:amino acid permease [Planctomycetota bacterium]